MKINELITILKALPLESEVKFSRVESIELDTEYDLDMVGVQTTSTTKVTKPFHEKMTMSEIITLLFI